MKFGKCNHTTNMKVTGQRAQDGDKDSICVEFEVPPPKAKKSESGEVSAFPMAASRASVCMSRAEAKHYPVGSTAAIHCVPGKDDDVAKDEYPDNLQGNRAKEEDDITAKTKGYRDEEDA